ncbi:hypothetical protein GCK32_017836 [Trichostrongylus colubriformis]|uniref:Uncharacterized protein n=1 Tax=Trichostrongylus colubriformis TaxID=6319 RepID=A0AAN8GC68_TRICO
MDQASKCRRKEITATSTAGEGDNNVYDGPEFKLAGTLQQLPLSEIQTLAEQPRPPPPTTTNSAKRLTKIGRREARMNPVPMKDKRKSVTAPAPRPKPLVTASFPTSSHSPLVTEALSLATSKGLRGGYIEFMRSNTDESIKRAL